MPRSNHSRLLLVSNRLPATVRMEAQGISIIPSAGGLATGLTAPHERGGGPWFGWPGDLSELPAEQLADIDLLLRSKQLVPVHLSADELNRYYLGYSNGVLWPLFHYLLDHLPLDSDDWNAYREVNQRFADLVASHYQEGDLVWVHDYHLMLVPQLLRERIPLARIGFFLHIPFPSSEVFRILPRRAEVLRGLLGADLIGFHTSSYLRHFSMSVLRILGLEADVDRLRHEGREVRLGTYPMGIDAEAFEGYTREPELAAAAEAIRAEAGGARIILCVDRLDYTKGISRRLLAFQKLLEQEEELRGRVRLVQIAVPSRSEVKAYEQFKRQVDELVGRINGKFGTASYTPIQYVNRSFTQRELVPLYLAADVMAVTPLRDGLNLVAKEYVACQTKLDGVLVLSEFAGVASELAEAIVVNPYDVEGMMKALVQALQMSPQERSSRLRAMRDRVLTYNVHRWADSFLDDLASCPGGDAGVSLEPTRRKVFEELSHRIRSAPRTALFLDYDGTLVPFAPHPDLASPDQELLGLFRQLEARPGSDVHLLSGRTPSSMEDWFGALGIHLHGEHGLWSRPAGRRDWVQNLAVSDEWKARVRPILEGFVKNTPGSFLEEKTAGLVWHYRNSDQVFGAGHAKELRLILIELMSNAPVEILAGSKVVEIRSQGINKGSIVAKVLAAHPPSTLALAMGDDKTDEDMFGALPEGSIAIHVGPTQTRAPYRLPGPQAAREFLRGLLG